MDPISRLRIAAATAALSLASLSVAGAQITIDGSFSWASGGNPSSNTYNASGSDKLVVVVSGEHNFGGNYSGEIGTITYDGQALTKAVDQPPVVDAHQTTSDIWYLDNPGSFHSAGTIVVPTVGNGTNWVFTAIGLSGTEDGHGATATASGASTVDVTATATGSIVIFNLGTGGLGNTAGGTESILPNSPAGAAKIDGLKQPNNYAGQAVAGFITSFPGLQTYSFDTTKTDVVTIAAEFPPPDLNIPTNPSPAPGVTVPGGSVDLSWTNLAPNSGPNVWVDVWFGTDPASLNQVVDASMDAANRTSATVTAPLADTYYWRVDSYLDGAPTGSPVTGSLFFFEVTDGDNDGMPDSFEEQYTTPPDPLALNPGDDLEPDGLTNLQEYNLGTFPDNPDSDNDGLDDGPELTGVGMRPPTDPTKDDSDGDGLKDGAESNTGTWLSTADTGTNPKELDSEGDGLGDEVETNTGSFIDSDNTGTNPNLRDSDADGAEDWYEVFASFTDPTDSGDKPVIPYPLPDPDGSTGVTTKPVKVYILSGQSNMVGYGRVDGSQAGTLETISKTEGKFPNLVDDSSGAWSERDDVLYRGVIAAIGNDKMQPGFGTNSDSFGPELGFGHVMGWFHDEPVLVIKSSQGGRALGWDFVPPGSTQFTSGIYTYAGYGDSPSRWETGNTPVPDQFYGGYQYDQCFLDEDDWDPGSTFGAVTNVTDILDDFANEYPLWAAQGFKIAGFAWFHGWNDGLSYTAHYANRYEQNMAQFIRELRDYYEGRYPGQVSQDAPFVIATAAFDGFGSPYPTRVAVAEGQLAMNDHVTYPDFAGNVKTMEARGYWRTTGPNTNQGYHYYHNAETYMLTGDALGRGMVELVTAADYGNWAALYPAADLSDPDADLDGDGLSNNEERIWGLDPTSGSSSNPFSAPLDPDTGTFSYTRRDTSLSRFDYSYQWSATLEPGSWTTFTPDLEDAGGTSPVETVTVTVDSTLLTNTRLFVRVVAN